MRVIANSTITHREGYTLRLERGPDIRRVHVNYEHVREPVIVPRPRIEDFNSLVVVHDKVEYYS